MAVYVDDMYLRSLGKFGRMKMSHMAADTHDELIDMVKKIGVDVKWIQKEGQGREHFDIAMVKRELAIKMGAKEVSMYDLGPAMIKRKSPNEKLTFICKS